MEEAHLRVRSEPLDEEASMFFDATTDRRTRDAIRRAHAERGKILGEVWDYLRGR
jgi:hypothetical protein